MVKELIVGTRGSKLALIQTKIMINALQKITDLTITPKIIATEGDQRQDISLRRTTEEGIFVTGGLKEPYCAERSIWRFIV